MNNLFDTQMNAVTKSVRIVNYLNIAQFFFIDLKRRTEQKLLHIFSSIQTIFFKPHIPFFPYYAECSLHCLGPIVSSRLVAMIPVQFFIDQSTCFEQIRLTLADMAQTNLTGITELVFEQLELSMIHFSEHSEYLKHKLEEWHQHGTNMYNQ